MKFLARLARRHSKAVVVFSLAITAVMGFFAVKIKRNADITENIPRSNPRLATYLSLREKYEGGNSVVILLTGQEIFSPAAIGIIDQTTRALQGLEGVTRVVSLTNAAEFRGTPEGIESGPLMSHIPETDQEALDLKAKILADPWYAGKIVSEDGQAALIVVTLEDLGSMDANSDMLHRVQSVVGRNRGGMNADYAGSTVMLEQIDRFLTKDLALLFPVVAACIVLILFFTFRSVRGVLLPLLTVLISVVWTIGLMSMAGRPLSLISNILPVLLVAVGSAYGIHIVARFQEARQAGCERGEAVDLAVRSTGFSVWMAALTTMAGFGSLALSKMQMIVDFGVFSAFGTFAAVAISITFIPALLHLLPPGKIRRHTSKKAEHANGEPAHGPMERMLMHMQGSFLRHRGIVLAVAVVLMALALLGWPRIKASFSPSEFLPAGSPHRRTEAIVDAKFGGSAELDVLVRGDLNDLKLLEKIAVFQARMEELGTGRTMSIVDLLARMNQAFHGGDPASAGLPSDPATVPQYLFLLTMSAAPGELSQFMTVDGQEARISARISNVMSTGDRAKLLERLEEEADRIFGTDTAVDITGTPVLEMTMMDLIRNEQMINIATSLIAVAVLVALAFKSLVAGLACLTPIVMTIAMAFGLMGWTGIPLNVATAIIAGLASGIGVDYGIHFYHRYREERPHFSNRNEALVETARTVGVPIIANALAVGAGFAALLLSTIGLFRSFGGLIALAMVLTAAGALMVLPVLLSFRRERSAVGVPKAAMNHDSFKKKS